MRKPYGTIRKGFCIRIVRVGCPNLLGNRIQSFPQFAVTVVGDKTQEGDVEVSLDGDGCNNNETIGEVRADHHLAAGPRPPLNFSILLEE